MIRVEGLKHRLLAGSVSEVVDRLVLGVLLGQRFARVHTVPEVIHVRVCFDSVNVELFDGVVAYNPIIDLAVHLLTVFDLRVLLGPYQLLSRGVTVDISNFLGPWV